MGLTAIDVANESLNHLMPTSCHYGYCTAVMCRVMTVEWQVSRLLPAITYITQQKVMSQAHSMKLKLH